MLSNNTLFTQNKQNGGGFLLLSKISFYGTTLILIILILVLSFKFNKKMDNKKDDKVSDEYIASYIDGEYQTEIPGKDDGYVVDKIVCDNGAVGEWDNEEWGINLRNATQKIKCSVYFKKALTILGKVIEDESQIATNDPDNNIRYVGAEPNNYVYFNCSNYSNQNDSTCEKWRIIGEFNNITKADGTKENLTKIIRNDSLGNFSWDYKQNGVGTSISTYGSNDWTDSQLMMMLNPTDYLKSGYTIENSVVKDSNSQAIYQNMGSYYNGASGCKPASITSGSSFSCTSIDFTSTGLQNDLTRNVIESVVWNVGGANEYNSSVNGLASHWYGYERGITIYSGHATTWIGKIGLMYPSDYGYATSGSSMQNRTLCLSKELYNWNSIADCYNNDYLYNSNLNQWTLTSRSTSAYNIMNVYALGNILSTFPYYSNYSVRPTLYLKSSISISKGDGSSSNPYQLKLN